MSRDDQTRVLRLWFAAVTVMVLLASVVVLAVRSNIEGPVALFLIIFQIPLFVPAIVYYFGATEPNAAKVCGMILACLTLPVAFLIGIMEEPPYTLVGGAFFLTLISSIVGAVVSRSQRRRRPDKARTASQRQVPRYHSHFSRNMGARYGTTLGIKLIGNSQLSPGMADFPK